MRSPAAPILELRDVVCAVADHARLGAVTWRCEPGAYHLIAGEPAAVRHALLRVVGLIDAPLAGEVLFEGENVGALDASAREAIRNRRCGYVLSAPFLLPALSVVENVAMPIFRISQASAEQARERTDRLLEFAGLTAFASAPAGDLPRAQQHATALARAFANEPALITVEGFDSALAPDEAANFSSLLRRACAEFRAAVIASAGADFPIEPTDRVLSISPLETARDLLPEQAPIE
jgi:ABC-type lipoprotein export system ATPase subunit